MVDISNNMTWFHIKNDIHNPISCLLYFSEPCQVAKYKLKKRFNVYEPHLHSFLFKNKNNVNNFNGYKYLIIRYTSTDTFIRETRMSISFSEFMSLLGGNLGLLLGLSCFTGFFIFYNYVGASFSPWRKMKRHLGFEKPK